MIYNNDNNGDNNTIFKIEFLLKNEFAREVINKLRLIVILLSFLLLISFLPNKCEIIK